jgi:hypothetical protein
MFESLVKIKPFSNNFSVRTGDYASDQRARADLRYSLGREHQSAFHQPTVCVGPVFQVIASCYRWLHEVLGVTF